MNLGNQLLIISTTCTLVATATSIGCQCREKPAQSGGITFQQGGNSRAAPVPQPMPATRANHPRAIHRGLPRSHPAPSRAAIAPQPVSSAPLALHLARATSVRITRLAAGGPEATKKLQMWSLTDRRDIAAMRAAVGGEQRASDSKCTPCIGATRVVFEDPMGLHLAELQLDCEPEAAVERGSVASGAQVRLGGAPVCGQVAVRDREALSKLIAKAETHGRNRTPIGMP